MTHYLDDTQRREIIAAASSWRWRTEWPTWLLIGVIYAGWFSVALNARHLGEPLSISLLAGFSAWYTSLQHELLHGHPTRFTGLNALFGRAPLAVWYPYGIYRRTHLRHHRNRDLTCPHLDPESFFITEQAWRVKGPRMRALMIFRNTLIGRVVIGPAIAIADTFDAAVRKIAAGDLRDLPGWTFHVAALAILLYWLDRYCGIPPWLFVLGAAYPAMSLNAVRSFYEHRVAIEPAQRTVNNEAAWPWRLLFLNNNFHAVHHDLPNVPWFALGCIYRQRSGAYCRRNGGFLLRGYRECLTRFAWRPVAPVVHPFSTETGEHPLCGIGNVKQAWTPPGAGLSLDGE